MNTQSLNPHQAFQPGADLWILPDVQESTLTRKINWLTNFQISRSKFHQKPTLSPVLKRICDEANFPVFSFQPSDKVIIPSSFYFPNVYTVLIPTLDAIENWTKNYLQVWRDLKNPSLRVFLPNNISLESYLPIFKNFQIKSEISFVSERSESL